MLDQIIIPGTMEISISYIEIHLKYISLNLLLHKQVLMQDTTPTFGGSRYLGGYSDHFPVTAEFQ
jgi:hypothetical protein